jgi:hypothetical protein
VRRVLALALTVGLALTGGGCSTLESAADPGASPSKLAFDWPAGASGAACELLEYGQVARELGVTFDTAGGAHIADTYTCALTQKIHDYPFLTLALSATTADDLIFTISVAPSGSTAVKGLGRAAYLLQLPAVDNHGPAIEYGWLSARPRLGIVRYTFGADATDADVTAMIPKLLTLAKRIEAT